MIYIECTHGVVLNKSSLYRGYFFGVLAVFSIFFIGFKLFRKKSVYFAFIVIFSIISKIFDIIRMEIKN